MRSAPEKSKFLSPSAWYLVVSVVVLGFKFWAYFLTNSQAILADAAESIVNVVASIFSIILLNLGSEPADQNHPYGHGKFEDVSSVIEGILIFVTGLVLAYTGVQALRFGAVVHDLDTGLIISLGATVLNLILARYLITTGRRTQVNALVASGRHVFSDVWTTTGVLVGLVLMRFTGMEWIDGALTLLMAILLLKTSFHILRESVGDLMDEMNPKLVSTLVELFEKYRFPGAIDLHHFRILRSGRFHHVDAHLVVPEFWTIENSHEIVTDYENKIQNDYRFELELAIHLDPCRRAYCRICDYPECPIRANAFESKKNFQGERLLQVPPPDEVL